MDKQIISAPTTVRTTPAVEYILAQGPQYTTMQYTVRRAFGKMRKAGQVYLEQNHYMRSSGGSGQLFVVERGDGQIAGACLIGATASHNCERSIVGACLIGPAPSKDAERSIAGDDVLIRQMKRSHLLDSVPKEAMCESQLLRHAMQRVCNEYDRPVLYVSFADVAATDERTGMPLCGWCYLAAGFFYAGETLGQRYCVIDHLGRARSTRQGKITLTRKTLPKTGESFHGEQITQDWLLKRLPPARVWLAVVTPDSYSRKRSKASWRACWRSLAPRRQVAAKIWINHVEWQRKLAAGKVSLGEPKPQHMRELDRFQPAWWEGWEMTRTAAPVWVPFAWQHELLLETDVEGERTANRQYKPLCA